jgi:hypothetical protein
MEVEVCKLELKAMMEAGNWKRQHLKLEAWVGYWPIIAGCGGRWVGQHWTHLIDNDIDIDNNTS